MTEKERFLMKLLFEYDWKEAFPNVKIADSAKVYYPKRNWLNFAGLIDGHVYSEKTIVQCGLDCCKVGDRIPYKDGEKLGFATVSKITKKTLFLDFEGKTVRYLIDSPKYYALIEFLAPYVQRIYYGWSDTYDLQEMIERDECIEVDRENQVYVCETTEAFQLRTILSHFLGYEIIRNRHYKTPKEPMNVGTSFTEFAEKTLDKTWERPKELDVGFRVYKLEGDVGDKVAIG